jgi:hypothetical protein
VADVRQNKRSPYLSDIWLWLAGANLLLCLVFLLLFIALAALSVGTARADWSFQLPIKLDDNKLEHPTDAAKPAYSEGGQATLDKPKAPNIQPYQVPTYDGKPGNFQANIPELAQFPDIDTESLFKVVVNCFPERVPWGFEAKFVGSARYTDAAKNTTTITSTDTSGIGLSKYYAGVVVEIPIFSASEVNTERRAEYQRRTQLSDNIANFVKGMAAMRRAWREIGIYNAATIRSQARVREGIAPTTEQLGYVEKVAEAYSKLDDAKAMIEGARLSLYGQCRNEVADEVNEYLKSVLDDFVKRASIKP